MTIRDGNLGFSELSFTRRPVERTLEKEALELWNEKSDGERMKRNRFFMKEEIQRKNANL